MTAGHAALPDVGHVGRRFSGRSARDSLSSVEGLRLPTRTWYRSSWGPRLLAIGLLSVLVSISLFASNATAADAPCYRFGDDGVRAAQQGCIVFTPPAVYGTIRIFRGSKVMQRAYIDGWNQWLSERKDTVSDETYQRLARARGPVRIKTWRIPKQGGLSGGQQRRERYCRRDTPTKAACRCGIVGTLAYLSAKGAGQSERNARIAAGAACAAAALTTLLTA